jgi:hypothetical protein
MTRDDGPSWWYQDRFPLSVYPNAVARFVADTAESLCVHPDLLATAVLPIVGTLIGNSRWIKCSDDGWHEPPKLWAGIIAEPGGKKSPALGRLMTPLSKIEDELETYHAHQTEEWKRLPKEGRPAAPKPIRLVVSDITTATIRDRLSTHPRGVLTYRDELTGWLEALGRASYGVGGDRQQWLELWPGSAVLRVDRKTGDESSVVRKAFVGLLGGIQPEKLRHIAGRDGDDGMLDRFLLVMPPDVEEVWGTPPVEHAVRDAYAELVDVLYRLPMGQTGTRVEPRLVELDVGGQAFARDFFEHHYAQKNNLRRTKSPLRGMWGKADAHVYRIALVLTELWHACEGSPEVVDEQRMWGALQVVDFFKNQRHGLQRLLESDQYDRPGPAVEFAVVDYVRRHSSATLKMLRHVGPLRRVSLKDARELVFGLAELGILDVTQIGKSLSVRIPGPE